MKSVILYPNQDDQYQKLLAEVIAQAKSTQYRVSVGVNQKLIRLYWFIGEKIAYLKADAKWGSKFFSQLSHDLTIAFPDMKGFSTRNLQYIKQMYDTFSTAITPQLVAQITPQSAAQTKQTHSVVDYISLVPWGHIRFILDKKFSSKKSLYYILKTIEYGWSRNMLLNMMAAELYESEGKSINNFPTTLPKDDSDYASEMLRNPYHLDFLNLNKDCKEKNDLVAQWTIEKNEQPIAITRYELKKLLSP